MVPVVLAHSSSTSTAAPCRPNSTRISAKDFTLLSPELLYNVNDTEFYTLALDKTALPLPLAPGPTGVQPVADFHVIVLP
jgi:hypothetical protein